MIRLFAVMPIDVTNSIKKAASTGDLKNLRKNRIFGSSYNITHFDSSACESIYYFDQLARRYYVYRIPV
jgi:hypothetical protein